MKLRETILSVIVFSIMMYKLLTPPPSMLYGIYEEGD